MNGVWTGMTERFLLPETSLRLYAKKIRIKCYVEVVIIPSRNIVKSPAATELTRNDGILIMDYGW